MRYARHISILVFLLSAAASAQAQYHYPPGYGGYGWHGWGAGAGSGRPAAGMGVFAAGAGQAAANVGERNVENSQARSMNVQTAMGINDYLYANNARNAQNNYARMLKQQADTFTSGDQIRDRVLNHPTDDDVSSGSSLNALLVEITSPAIYARTLELAQKPVPGALVRQIPFEYASAGITETIAELTGRGQVPDVYDRPAFAAGRKAAQAAAAELTAQTTAQKPPDAATIRRFRATLDGLRKTLEAQPDLDAGQKFEAEKYLKALYGLTKMIDSPSYDVYLAAVGAEPAVPLAEVLTFMHAFNLRFGAAKTAQAREIYSQLYGTLAELRRAVNPPPGASQAAAAKSPSLSDQAANFFGGMPYGHLTSPPPQPGLR